MGYKMVINLKKNVQIYKYLSNRQNFWKILTFFFQQKSLVSVEPKPIYWSRNSHISRLKQGTPPPAYSQLIYTSTPSASTSL